MSCDHGTSEIKVINEQVVNERITFKPCPWCAINKLKKYFISANDIPVERAVILAKDFWEIIGGPDE